MCSVYPLLQLSTAAREWVALHLLHYCVYAPNDPRSTRWAAPRTAHDAGFTVIGVADAASAPDEKAIRAVSSQFLTSWSRLDWARV